MNKTMRKIKAFATGAVAALALALALPAGANAANETLSSSFSLEPQRGSFLNNGFKAANWKVENTVSVPPGEPEILPSKVIDIGNPQGEMTFNPGNMPVCGNEIGPGNVSVPVDVVVARCPNSVLGNGTAQFAFRHNVHAGAKVGQRLDDSLVRVGLHGVAQRHVYAVKRLAQHLIVPGERRGGIAVEWCFKIERQVGQRNIFRVQDAITIGKVVHDLKIRNLYPNSR